MPEPVDRVACGTVELSADGCITAVNEAVLAWTGHAPEALLALPLHRLFTKPCQIFFETHLAPLVRMQGFVTEIALDLVCADGSHLPVLMNLAQVSVDSGEVLGHRALLYRATDRRAYERELLAARRSAENNAESKQQLVDMVSHDVRLSVNAIVSAVELLNITPMEGEQRQLMEILRGSSEALLTFVTDLLDARCIERGTYVPRVEPFSVTSTVEQVLSGLRPIALQKGIPLHCVFDAEMPQAVIGDAPGIRQIIRNLVANALKFTDQGRVVLRVEVGECTSDTVDLAFHVMDTGSGISEGDRAAIFERLAQGTGEPRGDHTGYGLGLAIARKLLALYGSELQVSSVPGHGTTFSFALRLAVQACAK